jgi:hypothetical protein
MSIEFVRVASQGVDESLLPGAIRPLDAKRNWVIWRLPAGAKFPATAHLVMDVELESGVGGIVAVEFKKRGGESASLTARVGLLPGVRTRLALPIKLLDGQDLFMRRTPLKLKATVMGRRLGWDEFGDVGVVLMDNGEAQTLRLFGAVRVEDKEPEYPKDERVLVDEFGQAVVGGVVKKDWPGRETKVAAMVARLRKARGEISATRPATDALLDGSKAHRFEATGFFRVEKRDGRWWMVTPRGGGMFSAGPDCIRLDEPAYVLPGTVGNFAYIPQGQPGEFAPALLGRPGTTAESGVRFMTVNLIRAFGDDWRGAWQSMTTALLMRYGFNTVSNWSDIEFAHASGMPYVLPMSNEPTTRRKLFRSLPDVFDAEYAAACVKFAGQLGSLRGDMRLIGYFLTNEPDWAFGEHNLASEMLEANPGTATRAEMSRWLREKYSGDAGALARAWGVEGMTFEGIASKAYRRVESSSAAAKADTFEFSRLIVRRWMEGMSVACRAALPGVMNLGVRWAWISSDLCYEVAPWCDVFTMNNYDNEPPLEVLSRIEARTGRPVLIGEFHHGATDRGLPSSGIQRVADQTARGVAYRRYVELCAAHPACVGAHYFQFADQPVLGRFDGENYQIGLVDICLRPYLEILEAAAETHARLAGLKDGSLQPVEARAEKLPPIFF